SWREDESELLHEIPPTVTSAPPLPAAFDFARWSTPAPKPPRWNIRRSVMAGAGAPLAGGVALFVLPDRSPREAPAVALRPAPPRAPMVRTPLIVQLPVARVFSPAPPPKRRSHHHHGFTRPSAKPDVDLSALSRPVDYDAPL